MDTWVWIVIVIAAIVVIGLLGYYATQVRQRKQLQEGFGPEYDRTVAEAPSKGEAEAELRERQKRYEEFDLQPLDEGERRRYLREWEATQSRFVDDPPAAIGDADRLIQQVMRDRGYPVDKFDQRAADLSVEHPKVVDNYRAGHEIATANSRGEASTEDLRQALVHYRVLFEELTVAGDTDEVEARR